MPKIGVFCGSSLPRDERITARFTTTVKSLAEGGWDLVYGGGNLGLMGIAAHAFLDQGRRVLGIIPHDLKQTEAPTSLTPEGVELTEVADMLERKELMMRLGDAFIILPGGVGTLDELSEVWTHKYFQTFCPHVPHAHAKPISMPLICESDALLLEVFRKKVEEGFISPGNFSLLHTGTPEESVAYLRDAVMR